MMHIILFDIMTISLHRVDSWF